MKKTILFLMPALCGGLLISCGAASPEKYFNVAILSTNMMHGFAGDGMHRQLESPSVKMVGNDPNKTEPMKRKEIVESKIQYIEESYEKLKALKETEDSKEVLQASNALYNLVLPVYKNEYIQLARLYDENATSETIQSYSQSISDKYYPTFVQLHEKLTAAGKVFADKHNIKVNWDIRTSPR